MNVTQQQVRRRGSSLDESAIRATLNQGLLVKPPQLRNNDFGIDTEKSTFSTRAANEEDSSIGYFPAKPNIEINESISQTASSCYGIVFQATFIILLSMATGFFLTAMTRQYFTMSEDSNLSVKARDHTNLLHLMRERCLMNTTYCPQLPPNQFSADYSAFVEGQRRDEQCYKEAREYDPGCEANCELLFRKMKNETEAQNKVTVACQLGCAYAKHEKTKTSGSLTETNCQFDCRNTVWVALPGKPRKCNYDQGLDLVTTFFESRHGSGVFGVGKACEIGCILGNSRPCPSC